MEAGKKNPVIRTIVVLDATRRKIFTFIVFPKKQIISEIKQPI